MQLTPVRLATNGTLLNFAQFLKALRGFIPWPVICVMTRTSLQYPSSTHLLINIEDTSFTKLYLTSVTYPTRIGVTDWKFLTVTIGSRTKSLKLYKTPHYYTECVYLVQCTIHAVKQTCSSPGESRQMLEEAINYKLSTMQSHQPVICPRHCP